MNPFAYFLMLRIPQVEAGLWPTCAALGAALFITLATPASAADPWTGAIRCEVQVTAPGYSHQETHTWTLTGAAPTVNGNYVICPAMWSVTGEGWQDRTGTTARRVARWAANVPGANPPKRAQIAFFDTGGGDLFVQLRHGQIVVAGGYTGTDQYINLDGVARPQARLVQTLYEWRFHRIEALPTDTQITGSLTMESTGAVAPLHPSDAQVMATLTWSLAKGGTAPPLPPATLPAPPPPPFERGGPAPGGNPGGTPGSPGSPPNSGGSTGGPSGGTGPNTPAPGPSGPGGGQPPTAADETGGPKLLSVTPPSLEHGAWYARVNLTGEATHWQQGTTTLGITPPTGLQWQLIEHAPTSLTAEITVAEDAPTGPRAVTVSTGSEVVTMADALTIAERAGPWLVSITPNSANIGDQNVSATFIGRNTHWEQGKMVIWFLGGGVNVTSINVLDTTRMTALLHFGADARIGPQDIMIRKHGPVDASGQPVLEEVVRQYGRFTVNAAPIAITEVTPSSASPGTRALTVSIKATGTHFNNVSWVDFGELVGATSFTVTSPTTATAVINIDPAAPPGPRTVSVITPVEGTAGIPGETARLPNGFNVGALATGARYRVTATRLKVHQEEWDHRTKEHGRNNEIFVSKHALVIDRRDRAKMSFDDQSRYTPIHGDINNASDFHKELRIRAGSFASSGGIQTGDDIEVWGVDWAYYNQPIHIPTNPQEGIAVPALPMVVPSSNYRPFVLWEGNLNAGIEVALIRPTVWLAAELLWSYQTKDAFFGPHIGRVRNETEVDFLALPAIRDALQRGLLVASPPELVTSGQWVLGQHRPFGLVVNGNQNGSPAKFSDVVVVLTHEKLQEWLSGTSSRNLELRMRSSMTGANPLPLGDCSLFLKIERLQ